MAQTQIFKQELFKNLFLQQKKSSTKFFTLKMILRRKSYMAEYKLKAVALRLNTETGKGNGNCADGQFFNVDKSMIGRWQKNKEILASLERNRRAQRHRSIKWSQLEKRLKNWILLQKKEKHQVGFFLMFYFLNLN